MSKLRLATIWLSGCSGCHMSFLDQDERLVGLLKAVDMVYSPLVDIKEFPTGVDITLVEGAIGNDEQLRLLELIRERTRVLVSLGDCAVTGNATALRNALGENSDELVLERAYVETASFQQRIPDQVPRLLPQAKPLHEAVKVDFFVPGCPPSADLMNYVLTELVSGRKPVMEEKFKYG